MTFGNGLPLYPGSCHLEVANQCLHLMPEKALFWVEEATLFLSDVHLGKAVHFQGAGIPLPNSVDTNDLNRIDALLRTTNAGRLVILGDLFHTNLNSSWYEFEIWRKTHNNLEIVLVRGNHDLIADELYRSIGVETHHFGAQIGPWWLSHFPPESINSQGYVLSGHLHPGVRLFGKAKQSLKLSCFYFGKIGAVLPAFGGFTGISLVKPILNDGVYVVTGREVLSVQDFKHELSSEIDN